MKTVLTPLHKVRKTKGGMYKVLRFTGESYVKVAEVASRAAGMLLIKRIER